MKGNQLIVLGAIAAVALGAALLLSSGGGGTEGGTATIGAPLLPGLDASVNEVERIALQSGEDALTLERGEDGWAIRERGGYGADLSRVRELLLALANAKLLEGKTSNPENYGALGLDTPITIRLAGGAGDSAPALEVGNSARRGSATYVRRGEEAGTWLVSGSISAQVDAVSWIDPIIVDIPGERIQTATITHPDGEQVTVAKAAREDTGYVVQDIPEGKQLRYESIANPIGSTLANLRLEDVRAADASANDGAATSQVRYAAFDGLVIDVQAYAEGESRWITIEASVDAEQVQRFAPTGDASETDASPAPEQAPVLTLEEVQAQAEALNARLAPWVFAIGRYKFEQLTRRMDDLVQDPPPPPEAE